MYNLAVSCKGMLAMPTRPTLAFAPSVRRVTGRCLPAHAEPVRGVTSKLQIRTPNHADHAYRPRRVTGRCHPMRTLTIATHLNT